MHDNGTETITDDVIYVERCTIFGVSFKLASFLISLYLINVI